MEENLHERLVILQEANLIDDEVAMFCKQVITFFSQEQWVWKQDNYEMFITHLAMAASREKQGKPEMIDNSIVIESIKCQEEEKYRIGLEILDNLLKLTKIQFSKSEKDMIFIHICSMLRSREENTL